MRKRGLWFFLAIVCLWPGGMVMGHICGPSQLTMRVGEAFLWKIDADLEEVYSTYTPLELGDATFAVTPSRPFQDHDGNIMIRGVTPGTNIITWRWFYPATQASGICSVTVTVLPALAPEDWVQALATIFAPPGAFQLQLLPEGHGLEITTLTLPEETTFDEESGLLTASPSTNVIFRILEFEAEEGGISETSVVHIIGGSSTNIALTITEVNVADEVIEVQIENFEGVPIPITIESSTNLQLWIPERTYSTAPEGEIPIEIEEVNSAYYRVRLGPAPLQLVDQPRPFVFPVPNGFATGNGSGLYWAMEPATGAPDFEGPARPSQGNFYVQLDPLTLPSAGNILFFVRDATHTTPVMSQPFVKVTTPVNEPPALLGLPDRVTLPRNSVFRDFPFTVGDDNTFPKLLQFVTHSHSGPFLNFGVNITTAADGTGFVRMNAFPNQTGETQLELRVFDGSLISTQMITVEIGPNTPPTITKIDRQFILSNTEGPVIPFTVEDAESGAGALTVTAQSLNQTVLDADGILLDGIGRNRTVVFTPKTNVLGISTVRVTVSDTEGGSTSTNITLVVGDREPAFSDFAGDVRADMIAQDDSGELAVWAIGTGTNIVITLIEEEAGTNGWGVVGSGFFDSDQEADLLFQHDDGTMAVWKMEGAKLLQPIFLNPPSPGPDQSVGAVGDFNRDGKSDIALQEPDGSVIIWEMNGINRIFPRGVSPPPFEDYKLAGSGDFDRDGNADFLFERTSGELTVWFMKGNFMQSEANLNPATPPEPTMKVGAVLDLDNDGKSDVVFQGPDGRLTARYLNGIDLIRDEVLNRPGPAGTWRVVGP